MYQETGFPLTWKCERTPGQFHKNPGKTDITSDNKSDWKTCCTFDRNNFTLFDFFLTDEETVTEETCDNNPDREIILKNNSD